MQKWVCGGGSTVTQLGRMVAEGRTSDVYEFGRGSVVKVPRPGVPHHWAAVEAEITAAVHSRGLPTPAVRGLELVAGRESVVFEHIDGPSMWQQIRDGCGDVSTMAHQLAEIHSSVHKEKAPPALPGVEDRTREKLDAVGSLSRDERDEAKRIVGSLPRGSALCHGDLHPGNILMSGRGPIVIDWFDAAAGCPIADVVRTSLLIRPRPRPGEVPHLPGATPEVLSRLHADYIERVLADIDVGPDAVRWWEAVLAASRLSEGAECDDSGLLALWRGEAASPLIEAISAPGGTGHESPDRRHELGRRR